MTSLETVSLILSISVLKTIYNANSIPKRFEKWILSNMKERHLSILSCSFCVCVCVTAGMCGKSIYVFGCGFGVGSVCACVCVRVRVLVCMSVCVHMYACVQTLIEVKRKTSQVSSTLILKLGFIALQLTVGTRLTD